ncbi:thioredoxin-like protein [Aquimarina sp. MAR_2010_214]|uniref:TlpA family protein disulfide reductase n=1 Tax=Aquimarina sp. MAR_2010_214 TaxID=1250026 RepID=UPI000C710DC4|nr:TlpA disulfide reductase family protein [Aquimarina sp. MAR_2010_214]PKV49060.1 thioredoxin-like protein [Aquimarina sp. MAR_2010_214]
MIRYKTQFRIQFLLICALFLTIGCTQKPQQKEEILIPIHQTLENDPFLIPTMPFTMLDAIPKEFIGIPDVDTVVVGRLTLNDGHEIRKLKKEKKLTDKLRTKIREQELFCVSGYQEDKQFYILDKNRNKDFSDDELILFDRSLSTDRDKAKDFFKTFLMPYKKIEKDTFIGTAKSIKVIPNTYSYRYNEMTPIQKIKSSLQLVSLQLGYWYGEFTYNDKNYKVAMKEYGLGGKSFAIFQESNKDFLKRSSGYYIEYNEGDMVRLDSTYFLMDRINLNAKEIYLRKLELKGKVYGEHTGNYIKDYKLNTLTGDTITLSSLFDNNTYLVLDFWGTWCGPCKKLTPDLKKLREENKDKLAILGIAYQEDVTKVRKYVNSNAIEWQQTYVKGKPKSASTIKPKIISELKVMSYPTFIILNKDLKIMYRGHGGSYKEMLGVIKTL